MCRLLMVKSESLFAIEPKLAAFARVCRESREYQGHGWGMAFERDGQRQVYRHIVPIWEESFLRFGVTRFLLVHARSAFRDEGIVVENNMPFVDDRYAFVFNGELRGVRVKAEGRIGAEKVFQVVKRFDRGDMVRALQRTVPFMERSTAYIRAMNLMISDMQRVYLCCYFNEDADYFTLYQKEESGCTMVCSQPFPGESGWLAIPSGTVKVF